MHLFLIGFACALLVAAPNRADAVLIGSTGLHPIAPTLGPFMTTPFAPDPQPLNVPVISVASPLGGLLGLTSTGPLVHKRVPGWTGGGWQWGGGYNGDVYTGIGQTLRLTMPANTVALYFFVEPVPLQSIPFTATAYDESNIAIAPLTMTLSSGNPLPTGTNAGYFAFYAIGGSTISHIDVTQTFYEYAIGEFGIRQVPEPNSVLLIAVAIAAWSCAKQRGRSIDTSLSGI